MAKHFPAGPNGVNGIESLQGIIDDEALASQIKMASKEDADACLRPMIMDYIKAKRPEMLSKIDTGDMKQEVEDEAITFEDIKPYVSIYKGNDGKNVFDVLDKDGKSVQKFDNANAAMKYLHANFDDLRKGSDEKEAMVDPEGNPQYGDESKEIALDLWNDMSKEEKEEHGSFGAYLKSDDFQEYLNKLRSKFEKDAEDKIDVKIDPDGGISKVDGDNSLDNKEETVEDFVKSFFDYTTNQFPKGETAVLTSVEKKFGDGSIKTAQETISKLMQNKDPEIAKIKKLAGV